MKPLLSVILALPVFLASCGNVLKPVEDISVSHLLEATVPERRVTGNKPAIAIAQPALPSYLDRLPLVSRARDGVLVMNQAHQWAEPLDAAISRVTSLNLGRLKNSLNIQPVDSFVTLDYEKLLEIRVSRFEPNVANQLVFEATWKLQPVNGPVAETKSFSTVIPIPGTENELEPGPLTGRIDAMNLALARLAREIAQSL